jgi:UDP-MurNAc hydroxylase
MKFTILSHAGMLIEDDNTSVLIDPWLIGSCYWRSWWNFPEPVPELIQNIKPDYIYLTHLHWDHFHGPSLRLFDKETKIIVPLVHTHRMVDDLNSLGFKNVIEVPHGQGISLGKELRLHSYQFGLGSDSAPVITNGRTTLFNMNDCKFFGLPLKKIKSDFPKIDFLFRSHSSAAPLPYCVEDYEQYYQQPRSAQDYIEEFSNCAMTVGAKYAIPFASNHCFLHRETKKYNGTAVLPNHVSEFLNDRAKQLKYDTQCMVMPPGSSWDDHDMFKICSFDYDNAADQVTLLSQKHEITLDQQYAKEEKAIGSFKAFSAYFNKMMKSLPSWLSIFIKVRLLFEVQEANDTKFWLLDLTTKEVSEVTANTSARVVIRVAASVLNDCTRKKMFSTWTPSKRLSIVFPDGDASAEVSAFFSLLDLYENDFFPMHLHLTPRYLGIWLIRWREFVEFTSLVIKHKVLKKPFRSSALFPVGQQ